MPSTAVIGELCETRVTLVGSRAYLDRVGRPATPQDIAEHECIIDTNRRDPWHWRLRTGDAFAQVPVRGRLLYSNAEACLKAAEAGLGLAYVPNFVAADAIAAGRVEALLKDHMDESLGVFALYPPGRHLAAKVRVLIEHLAGHFRGSKWGV